MFGVKLNKDWALIGGSVILGVTALVFLHNRFGTYVPTVPGVSYGPGGVATGIYTGNKAPYSPVPVAQDVYGPIGATAGPYINQAQGIGRQGVGTLQTLGYFGGWQQGSGGIGRGGFRDSWTDVYDPKKGPTSGITHDDPDKRVSVA